MPVIPIYVTEEEYIAYSEMNEDEKKQAKDKFKEQLND